MVEFCIQNCERLIDSQTTFTGPALLKVGVTKAHDWNGANSPAYDRWVKYVETKYGSATDSDFHKAYATDIVEYYSNKYGDQVDGWVSRCMYCLISSAAVSSNSLALTLCSGLIRGPVATEHW